MAASVLEGENPWNFIAKSVHDPKVSKWAIIPKVARVFRQYVTLKKVVCSWGLWRDVNELFAIISCSFTRLDTQGTMI